MDNIYDKVLKVPGVDFGEVRDGRRSPIAYFDVDLSVARSIAARTALIIPVAADTFYSDVDPVNQGSAWVHFQDTLLSARTSALYVVPGFIAKAPFTQLMVENLAQPGKILRVFYGVGIDFTPGASSSVSVSGNVSVIDGNKARTIAGQVGIGGGYISALGGNYSRIGIYNLPGTKRAIIRRAMISSATAQAISFGRTVGAVGSLSVPQSALQDGTVYGGVVQTAFDNAGAPGITQMGTIYIPANQSYPFVLDEPIVLMPGASFLFVCATVNTDLAVVLPFVEETI